jgi:hypothetical protein
MIKIRGKVSTGASKIPVRWKRLLAACALLSALAVAGRAGVVDPQVGMENAGDCSLFTSGVTFTPDPTNGGGTFDYCNATGGTITSLTFTTNIGAELDPTPSTGPNLPSENPEPDISCNNAMTAIYPNPFFLFCGVSYISGSGELIFNFNGTNSTYQGIPADGSFIITLNTGFNPDGNSGGWLSYGDPSFTASNVQIDPASTPEPDSALFVGIALLAGMSLLSLRRRA